MRKQLRYFLAVLLVFGATFAVAAPALAQEGGGGDSTEEPQHLAEAEEHCIEAIEGGGTVDDCQEAPNPLLPALNEVLWGMAAFLVLLVLMWKFAMPQVKSMMQAREDRIRGDLEQAESARTSAEEVKSQYEHQLAEARNEAGTIIEEARQAAEQVRRDLIARAETEAAEIRERAQADIETQRQRALAELRTDVADLSIDLAERIVEHNLDRDTQLRLVDSFINQVGSN